MTILELLASPPGTGKTHHCIEIFREEILKSKGGIESRSFFVLPSREHAERIQNLILRKEVAGLFNVHILTINELVARLVGSSQGSRPTDSIRRSVIRAILEEGDFPYFQAVKELPGFHALLADAVKEFKSNLLSIADFERRAQMLLKNPAFKLRYKDFSILLKKYEARLEALGLSEVEDEIRDLSGKNAPEESMDLVIFDGFYDFTLAQRRLLLAVAKTAQRVVVTLTVGTDFERRSELFYYSLKTREFLKSAGFKEKKLPAKNHRVRNEALLFLEKNIFLESPKPQAAPPKSIRILEASNARDEIIAIAREIRRIYRAGNTHFSDICLILRKVSSYEKIVEAVFSEFDVPVHIHERKKLIEHGFAATLHRLLNLGAENWKREDLLYVLKSSYFSDRVRREDVLALQSMAVAGHVTEGRQAWENLAVSDDFSEETKQSFRYFFDLEARLSHVGSAAKAVEMIDSLLPVAEDLLESQALKALRALLQKSRAYYRDAHVFSAPHFFQELRGAIEAGLFSVRPRGRNRVQVYDAVMALSKEYKTVFIAGLLEKSFPLEITEDPLFKDDERRVINRKEPVLEERRLRSHGEKYFFYMATARAKENLYLTYPSADTEGKSVLPSFFLEEVKKCFPALRVQKTPDGLLPPEAEWETEEDVTRSLLHHVFERENKSMFFREILDAWRAKDFFKSIVATGYRDGRGLLTDPQAIQIFSSPKTFSATRLETYDTCAFKYFASRALYLIEPLEGRENLEMGRVLHEVLETFYKELPAKQRADDSFWNDRAKIKKNLLGRLQKITQKSFMPYEPLYRRKMHLESMAVLLEAFVDSEAEFHKQRKLEPTHFEFGFDSLKIPSPEGEIVIEGKIDRIDVLPGEKKALVVDYKRSVRQESIAKKLESGVELQLPIYLLALRRVLKLEPVGAELRFLKKGTKEKEGIYREDYQEYLLAGSKKQCYSEEAFEKILEDAEARIRQIVGRVRQGDISVKSRSCQYCSFDPVCRFEKWKLIYSKDAP